MHVPAHEKVFIDSVIRNTTIASQYHPLDSDDESEADDFDEDSANESGDDVHCECDSDEASSFDGDADNDPLLFPNFDKLDISFNKEFLIMNRLLLIAHRLTQLTWILAVQSMI